MSLEDEEQEAGISKASTYKEMAVEEPELDVDPDDDGGGGGTLSQRIDDSANLSDFQNANLKLYPEDLGDAISNKVMVARIDPGAFQALLYLMTKSDIARADPRFPIVVEDFILKNYILLTIGLDGKGRIHILELAGAAKEAEESASELKKLLA